MRDELTQLRAENERLRTALMEVFSILEAMDSGYDMSLDVDIENAMAIVKVALHKGGDDA